MNHYLLFLSCLLGSVSLSWSQTSYIMDSGLEYSLKPNVGNTSMEQYQLDLNLLKKTSKNNTIKIGASYTNYSTQFSSTTIPFDASMFEKMHALQATLSYSHYLSSSWSAEVVIQPSLRSNFKEPIGSEDFLATGTFSLSKKWVTENSSSLVTFGIGYGTILGAPQLYPLLSYKRILNNHWNYILGFPETAINYTINERHQLTAKAMFDGFYNNNATASSFIDTTILTDTKIVYNSLDLTVEHQYRIQPNWTTLIKLGYTPWNQLQVVDTKNNELYDFSTHGSVLITMGLRFNLNSINNENK